MRTAPRFLIAAVLVTIAVLATSVSPASADAWIDDYYDNSGQVCIQGINGAVVETGGLRFKSETRSYNLDCTTARPLPANFIVSSTGVRSLDWNTAVYTNCGFVTFGGNANGTSWASPASVAMTNAQIRSFCGVPAGNFATAGAYSDHSAVIWGTYQQTGRLIGNQAAAI